MTSQRDVKTIYTEDVSSGRVHARILLDGAELTDERCNLDDAGEHRTITLEEALAKARVASVPTLHPAAARQRRGGHGMTVPTRITRRAIAGAAIAGAVLTGLTSGASGRGNPHRPPKPTPGPSSSAVPLSGVIDGASVLFGLDHADRDTDAAVAAGLDTIRIVNFLDEGRAGDPYDAWRWSRVDALIAAAKARGLRVILDLSTYRNQRRAQAQDPYGDWSAFLAFVGRRYRAETAIAYYALAGEPAIADAGRLVEFYARATADLHVADPDTPVSSGGLLQYGWDSGIDWRAIFRAVDVPAVHVYSSDDEAAVPALAADATSLGKPFVIEEFGFPQAVGDEARASAFGRIYALAASVKARGVAFWNLGPQVGGDTYDVNTATPLTWREVLR